MTVSSPPVAPVPEAAPMTRPPCAIAAPTASSSVLADKAAAALRRIAARVEAGTAQACFAPEEGVLLDTVVGGVRCLLQLNLPPRIEVLSPREGQIARMVAEGRTNRAMASALDLSSWTVSTHLRRIFAKLGVGSRAEMVAHLYGGPHLRN